MTSLFDLERHLKHVWDEPKSRLAWESPSPMLALLRKEPYEKIDPDWWEPRYDQPWRRQVARTRDEFGGAYVARPKAPVEGPNNPNRIQRELEYEHRRLAEAEGQTEEGTEEAESATERIRELENRR